jgi:hypothetical protein
MIRTQILGKLSLAIVAAWLGGIAPAGAQDASLYGTVVDPSGDPVPGVTVTATNQDTGASRSTVSDGRGQYRIPALPIGLYSVLAELTGFKTINQTDLRLLIGQELNFDITLEIAAVEESITVTAAASPLVETRRSELAANVTEEQILNIPVKSRAWLDIATILPQAHQDAIRAIFYNSVNIGSGVLYYTSGFYVDGVNNNWQEQGEPRQDFPQDAVGEFRVYGSNARSEFGWSQGGYMSVVTKSGTNQFHGSVYDYFRTKALNSKTVFQTEKPDYSRNQFGGSLGGPVIKDKAHFFVSYEYTDEEEFFTVNTNGIFPEEEGNFPRPFFNRMFLLRYDHTVNNQNQLFVRYAHQKNQRAYTRSGGIMGVTRGHTFGAPRDAVVAGLTSTIGDNMLNQLRVQWAKSTFQGWPSATDLEWTRVAEFPQERLDSLIPQELRPSLQTGQASAFLGPERHFQIRDDFTRYLDRHEIKFGASLEWVRYSPDSAGDAGIWNFATDRDFDPNDRATYPFLFQQSFPNVFDIPNGEHSLYFDDTWTLSSNFVLNLGIRYDWSTQVWNENLLEEDLPEIAYPVNGVVRVVQEAGIPNPALYPFYDGSNRGDWNNFGPRIGFNWTPGGTGRQSVRGAYGIYYNRYRSCPSKEERSPQRPMVILQNPNYPDPYQGQDPLALARASRNFVIEGNENRNPYAHQFNLGYTRQLADNLTMDLDASFANAYYQHRNSDHNYFLTPADRAAGVRPFPEFGQVRERLTDGTLKYRALGVRLERRFSDNWQLLGSYTLAWAKSDASEGLPADNFNRQWEYGFVPADRRHRLAISGMVQLPYGFQTSGVVRWQSDLPFNVTAGADLNRDALALDRPPNVTAFTGCRGLNLDDVNAYRALTNRAPVTDTACPDFLALDVVLMKEFQLGESYRIEGLVQIFNLFNRANYFPAEGNALSALFGQSVQVTEPRQIELAVRFRF